MYAIIKPEGFVIDNESEACQINGITQELAMECGVTIQSALSLVDRFVYASKYVGFYNAQFDVAMLTGEAFLIGRVSQLHKHKCRCFKEAYTELCKIPSPYGYSDFKWPTLEEAYEWTFGKKPEGAHNALADARFTADLAFAAVDNKWWYWEPDSAE